MLASLPYETLTFLPYYVAREAGFFKDEGVEVDYLYRLSGGRRGGKRKAVDLCLAGEVVFFTAVSCAVEAQLLGWGDVKALAATNTRGSSLFARPSIRTVADLKGKRLMVGGGASVNEMKFLASTNGWEIGRDLFLIRGNEVDRAEAFANPEIDGVCARLQYRSYADRYGFHIFQIPGAVWHEGGICTSAKMIEEQPDVVQAVVNAFVRAMVFIKENKAEAVKIGERNIRWLDEAGVASHYDIVDFSPDMTEEGLRWMINLLAVAKGVEPRVAPSDVADMRFLQRAKERYWPATAQQSAVVGI